MKNTEMKQLYTRFSERTDPDSVLREYPRPMLRRDSWQNLNGLWNYAVTSGREEPASYDGRILVPFSPETALSGVQRKILPGDVLWYRRTLPPVTLEKGRRLLLHFGAVDQHAWVYLNGTYIGEHHGGYLPFSCDLTDALNRPQEAGADGVLRSCGNALTVRVVDRTDTSYHSRGKQKLQPSGMYYTAQSGIWQTVWMEAVPENHIRRVAYLPDYDRARIRIKLLSARETPVRYTVYEAALYDSQEPPHPRPLLTGEAATNRAFSVSLPDLRAWSPETPYLYAVIFETEDDSVQSYFAMRKCDVQKDADGVPRLFLNNRPYFQTGLLDQGYYPESLYTPPSDEALTADILSAKRLGFNMLRKHAKLEPDRFYYHCDRLGMLVWQDMVNGGSSYKDWFVTYLATALNRVHILVSDRWRSLLSRRDREGRREFVAEAQDTVRCLGAHPCIVVWVPFNEGWGQFDTLKICAGIKKMDPSRLVDHASGWFDQKGGDFQSIHYYFFRYDFKPDGKRAMALTEYGGYSYSIPDHCVNIEEYGYQKYSDPQALTGAFRRLIEETVLPSVREGLSAAIYTQLTDIEGETNGIYTYDRKVCKLDAETVRECNRKMKEAGAGRQDAP